MSLESLVKFASDVVTNQTNAIRRFLRKNRTRVVYRIENNAGLRKNVYNFIRAVRLAAKHGGDCWIWQGNQKADWIEARNLTGIRWNKKRTRYLPKINHEPN
jgi:hypothetical protein